MELSVSHANNKDAVKLIYSSLVLIAKIFYSLNFQVSDTSAVYNVLENCFYSLIVVSLGGVHTRDAPDSNLYYPAGTG